jgi:cobalt/nickel transport protein
VKRWVWYVIGLAIVVSIFVLPFIISSGASFGGSDDQGSQAIEQIDPGHQVWFQSLWQPPPETASLLFAVQAAIGASIIGYFIGTIRGKRIALEKTSEMNAAQVEAIRREARGDMAEREEKIDDGGGLVRH